MKFHKCSACDTIKAFSERSEWSERRCEIVEQNRDGSMSRCSGTYYPIKLTTGTDITIATED